MSNKNEFQFAIHPGRILKRYLSNINMTQKELSVQTGINKTIINELIKGKRSFTINLAMKLVDIFDMPATYWCNLQNMYDENMLRLQSKEKVVFKSSEEYKSENFKKIEYEVILNLLTCAV